MLIPVVRAKAAIEVRICQLSHAERLQHPGSAELRVPRSGMRVLLTRKECARQDPHMNVILKGSGAPFRAYENPSYSVLFSGDKEFGLLIFPCTPSLASLPPAYMRAIA